MTKIGTAILDEYIAEKREHIDDDKIWLRFDQGWSFLNTVCRIIFYAFGLYFVCCLAVFLLILRFIDDTTLNLLRASSNEKILADIAGLFNLALLPTFLVGILLLGGFGVRLFRNVKAERIDRDAEKTELIATMIDINEELLRRHKLIQPE